MPSPITGIVTAINQRRPAYMTMLSLQAQKREGLGKGANRRLRVQNLVPCVFYSENGENIVLQVQKNVLEKLYNKVRRTTVFNLEIEGAGTFPVIIWDAQYHPTKSTFTHVDFYGVDLDKEVQITVPVEFIGTSRGAKMGGKIELYRENVRLSAKPQAMPAKITIDISDLDLNKTVRVEDLQLPEGVKAVYKSNFAFISCLDPKGLASADDA